MELLRDFVDYLKTKSSRFHGINIYELKSTQAGTMQLHDYMRKRVNRHD